MIDRQLGREATKHKRLLAAVTGLGAAGGVLAVVQAYLLAHVIDGVFLGAQDLAAVSGRLWFAVAIIVARSIVMWLEGTLAFQLAAAVKTGIRERLVKHLLGLGPVVLANHPAGQLINVLSEGVENLEAYFSRYLPQLVKAVMIPVFILVVTGPLDSTSAAIMLVTAPLIPVFMLLIGRMAERMNTAQWETLAQLSAHFLDVLAGLTTLKIFGRSKEQAVVIARLSGQFQDATLDVLKVAFLSALALELVATISTALVAVTVGLRLVYGEIAFVQAFFVLLLAPEYYLPLRLLGSQFHAGMAGKTAAAEIFRLLSLNGANAFGGERRLVSGQEISIEFDNVCAAYQEGERPALNGVSFTVAGGQHVAIVGPSGAGKSTIAGLLLGFVMPKAGIISVNGIPLGQLERSHWLEQVAVVPQRPHLFQGTVADNIRLGKSDAPLTAVIEAARAAGAHGFISVLPDGYETQIGESGQGLSGGQRQRLAIARAFLKASPFIILDEVARGLDAASQAELDTALARLLTGRTALIIAHRLSTVRQADSIVVLADGQIQAKGSHAELMAQPGLYPQLVVASQAGEGV